MREVLILGGNELHKGFVNWKQRNAVDSIVVIDWNEVPAFQGDFHFREDIKDTKKVLEIIKHNPFESLMMCYTSADIAVPTQLAVHKHMNLLTPSEESVWNAIVKSRSVEKWQTAGILNRFSQRCKKLEDLSVPSYVKDVIIKPNMSSGSRGITIIKEEELSRDSLEKAFKMASINSADHTVVVEEFLHGTEYTVEMLGDDYGNVAVYGISQKYYTKYVNNNKIATKLHYNAQSISEKQLEDIARIGQECYKALGLRNSLGHLEVMIAQDGRISPIEMGARSSGYIATHCIDAINKESFLLKYSCVIRGEKVENGITFDRSKSSMYFFYDIPPGKSCKETNLMEFAYEGIQSIQWNRSNLIAGKSFDAITQDAERYGYEILNGARSVLTIDKVEEMEKRFVQDFMS